VTVPLQLDAGMQLTQARPNTALPADKGPRLVKGALAALTQTFLVPLPNVTVFQFNPESLTHTWTQPDRGAETGAKRGTEASNPFAVAGLPGESFSFTAIFDSNQDIEDSVPYSSQLADVSGVYTRLAALEMLLYPVGGNAMSKLLGQTSAALGLSSSKTSTKRQVPASSVPVVLFVWGPYRIVPVRVTGLTIVEKLYDATLNPTHAEVQVALRVLTPAELSSARDTDKLARLATVAYTYTLGLRQVGAAANVGNSITDLARMF
jgi:hypothetical protein